ncbi:uncharacterized protein EV422DRAFT_562936 [Fimicolochytrium jonesii]|uniref:uncharacterized protein n=1 Tax=Fimicolochytrium jonesii TaxID=1396493 RepID=UPI0022FE0141|nr:uncharacterized protein EV422DRAFT_562936 [Fimicolochytrium jonesii]KAI8826873.1 hypothetical protein EV422DRAFT_562936 [Fimicolochytrium jonesii]
MPPWPVAIRNLEPTTDNQDDRAPEIDMTTRTARSRRPTAPRKRRRVGFFPEPAQIPKPTPLTAANCIPLHATEDPTPVPPILHTRRAVDPAAFQHVSSPFTTTNAPPVLDPTMIGLANLLPVSHGDHDATPAIRGGDLRSQIPFPTVTQTLSPLAATVTLDPRLPRKPPRTPSPQNQDLSEPSLTTGLSAPSTSQALVHIKRRLKSIGGTLDARQEQALLAELCVHSRNCISGPLVTDARLTTQATIHGHPATVLLDTGCSTYMISDQFVKAHRLRLRESRIQLEYAARDSRRSSSSYTVADITIDEYAEKLP